MNERLSLELPAGLVDAIANEVLARLGDLAPDPWYDVDQAADYIGASRQRIYDLRREGKLPKTGDGRRVRLRRSALDRYLEQGAP